ncbi:hypothetical protein P691DRAFT_790200, partial [Macrolepiota fuliginosa MF-IS2]
NILKLRHQKDVTHGCQFPLPGSSLAGSTINSFLDIEVAVAGDDEGDKEANEDDLNFFINDQDLNKANGSHACSNIEAEIATQPHGAFLSALAGKYGPCTRDSSSPATESQEAGVSQSSPHALVNLPPQEGDWELWEVPATVGLEFVVIYHILQRVVEGLYVHNIAPWSTFTSHGMIGRVYMEAWQWSDIATICRGMSGVRWWEMHAVPLIDRMTYLNQ